MEVLSSSSSPFLQSRYNYVSVRNHLKFHALSVRKHHLDDLFLFDVYTVENCWPSCAESKSLKILLCLMLTLNVSTVLPLEAIRRQVPSVGILVYSVEGLF